MKSIPEIILFGLIAFLLNSCTQNVPSGVKNTLKFSGENRFELEKVIEHYQTKEDSLKLKAAYFLIENMPYHFYFAIEDHNRYDELFDSISVCRISVKSGDECFDNELRGKAIDRYVNQFLNENRLGRYRGQICSDAQTIDSEFLIENIDYAFKAWEFPWARQYSLDEFCRYILPYRYGNEAPDRWRKKFYNQFKWVVDSIKNPKDVLEVTSYMNKLFRNKVSHSHALSRLENNIKPSQLAKGMVVEGCEGQTGMGECILRSIGVPVSIITFPWWGNRNVGHNMNALLDSSKQWQYFAFDDWDPSHKLRDFAPKIYFKQFARVLDQSIVNQQFMEDGSRNFQNVKNININVIDKRIVYLYVFGDRSWSPIDKAKNNCSGIVFENVGTNDYMYMAAVLQDEHLEPVTYPFRADSIGNPIYYIPDSLSTISFTFDRKYPPKDREARCDALIDGQFQTGDKFNFSKSRTIYSIKDRLKYQENILKIKSVQSKYIRYVFPEGVASCWDGPAEVAFYHADSTGIKKLTGRYFGSSQLSSEQIKIMTDGDILTYVEWKTNPKLQDAPTGNIIMKEYAENPIWIGLELDSITEITHVGICPRNDKNGIYPGMYYELFYWDNQWKSLGKKIAMTDMITYDHIPSNALLWLRNFSEGKEERIFTIKDGKQIWW
ncbi:hypothetical protein BZG01_10950 [Labilibaculum manganireducens]|uniref:Peptide-N(4)-(N-acetyl-beta-glucosaminyl)asparagine amidase n=1 Tax=Labilibaculum manganireducens TaxID=1940525 RepID=A0A2N3I8B9_9BACT|nr:hypothetical protein [Labilibaculum manganireducens]PKQ66535.1 hypothetical protein BZG01_10950 [Labilibaculum manganireducens]